MIIIIINDNFRRSQMNNRYISILFENGERNRSIVHEYKYRTDFSWEGVIWIRVNQ
jgi:hypothetical protein